MRNKITMEDIEKDSGRILASILNGGYKIPTFGCVFFKMIILLIPFYCLYFVWWRMVIFYSPYYEPKPDNALFELILPIAGLTAMSILCAFSTASLYLMLHKSVRKESPLIRVARRKFLLMYILSFLSIVLTLLPFVKGNCGMTTMFIPAFIIFMWEIFFSAFFQLCMRRHLTLSARMQLEKSRHYLRSARIHSDFMHR